MSTLDVFVPPRRIYPAKSAAVFFSSQRVIVTEKIQHGARKSFTATWFAFDLQGLKGLSVTRSAGF